MLNTVNKLARLINQTKLENVAVNLFLEAIIL